MIAMKNFPSSLANDQHTHVTRTSRLEFMDFVKLNIQRIWTQVYQLGPFSNLKSAFSILN